MLLISTVKGQIISVTNDYSKFYMLQVMLIVKNKPAKTGGIKDCVYKSRVRHLGF